MEWQRVQEILNELENDYINLSITNEYLSKEENYETDNKNINVLLFYFIKSLNKKIQEIPCSINDARNVIFSYGNDANKMLDYLNNLKKDLENINHAIDIIKVYVDISDKSYEFKDGYENSLIYKYHCDIYEKMAEVYDNDSMTTKEKYEYCNNFEENLSEMEKGELHVQSSIGKADKALSNKVLMNVMMNIMKGGSPFEKANKFQQCLMDAAAFAKEKQNNASLEDNLKMYGNILESDFYKSFQNQKNI